MKNPTTPVHLSKKMRQFWATAVDRKHLKPDKLEILVKACEAHDRAAQAGRILKRQGLTFADRFGQLKPRPEIKIEHDSRAQFVRLLKEANLFDPFFM